MPVESLVPQPVNELHRRRIAIVIHALHGGGSEHVAAKMASYWASTGDEVTLITLSDVSSDAITLNANVRRIGLDVLSNSTSLLQAVRHNAHRIRQLRASLLNLKPDCVISLVDRTNVLTLLACRGTGLPVFVCERTDVRHHQIGRIWNCLRRWTYPLAQRVVIQTSAVQEALQKLIPRARTACLPNFISLAPENTESQRPLNGLSDSAQWVCSVGRLSPEKGFDVLINAFAEVAPRLPHWNLAIVGDGTERPKLEALIRQLGLESRVSLLGWSERPWELLAGADLFVMSSRYEGFPNALMEAMARGLAVISTDCDSGPREIIHTEVDGLLVPSENVPALAEALERLMSDSELRRRFGQNARAVSERFSIEKHFARWDELLAEPFAVTKPSGV